MRKRTGRYWVFAYDGYYPLGGMADYKFSFNTIDEFEEEILRCKFDMFNLLDTETKYDFHANNLDTLTKWVCNNVGDEKYET